MASPTTLVLNYIWETFSKLIFQLFINILDKILPYPFRLMYFHKRDGEQNRLLPSYNSVIKLGADTVTSLNLE